MSSTTYQVKFVGPVENKGNTHTPPHQSNLSAQIKRQYPVIHTASAPRHSPYSRPPQKVHQAVTPIIRETKSMLKPIGGPEVSKSVNPAVRREYIQRPAEPIDLEKIMRVRKEAQAVEEQKRQRAARMAELNQFRIAEYAKDALLHKQAAEPREDSEDDRISYDIAMACAVEEQRFKQGTYNPKRIRVLKHQLGGYFFELD